jgi:hypothetical protein
MLEDVGEDTRFGHCASPVACKQDSITFLAEGMKLVAET